MKIIWVVEPVMPQIARMIGAAPSIAGGWLASVCDGLLDNAENHMIVCYRTAGAPARVSDGRLTGWSFAQDPLRYSPELERAFSELLRAERPDVIHIWGTEFPHSLAMLNAAERERMLARTAVSIQGLISEIAKEFTADLPDRVVDGYTFRDLVRGDNIRRQQEKFALRGTFETEALRKARHVIGRTSWDHDCVQRINQNAVYHFCDETLRKPFYEGRWNIETCERHSVFVSQGNYPIKGLHMALEALAILKRKFPDVMLYTTGEDPRKKGFQARLRRSGYALYLANRIRALGLEGNVSFLGNLSAAQMRERYLRAHVALNSSSIENSSNAIGEAMLLGTPVVASAVGGTPDIVTDRKEGLLYPFGEPGQLAEAVQSLFSDDALAERLSEAARRMALRRHDADENLAALLAIYRALSTRKDE